MTRNKPRWIDENCQSETTAQHSRSGHQEGLHPIDETENPHPVAFPQLSGDTAA